MSLSIGLGVVGILVSIGVGFGTYWLAERRSRRNRWQGAKDIVLRDLSKSLGEGSVPPPQVILATIRSVLRGQNAPDLAVVTLEEVKDDLLRQITADPFLDVDRRKQLQAEVLELHAPETPPMPPGERPPSQLAERESLPTQFSFTALLAGVVASVIAAASVTGIPTLLKEFERLRDSAAQREPFLFLVPVIAGLLTLLASVLSMFARTFPRKPKEK